MKFTNIVSDAIKGYESIEDFAMSVFNFPVDDCLSFFRAIDFQSKRQVIMAIDKIFLKYKNYYNGQYETKIQQRSDKKCK